MEKKTLALLPEQAPPHAPEGTLWWFLDELDFDQEPGEPSPQFIDNVRRCGILVPIVVRYSVGGGRPRVLDGVRRCKAARIAGLKEVSVVGAPALDDDVVTLIANNNRSPNPRTELAAIERLIETTGATPKALARELGIPYGTVKRRMKLRRLAASARRSFEAGEIAIGVAERMSSLSKKDQGRVMQEAMHAEVPVSGQLVSKALQVRHDAAVAEMPREMFAGPGREDVRPDPTDDDLLSLRRADLDKAIEYISMHNHADFDEHPEVIALLARLEEVLRA